MKTLRYEVIIVAHHMRGLAFGAEKAIQWDDELDVLFIVWKGLWLYVNKPHLKLAAGRATVNKGRVVLGKQPLIGGHYHTGRFVFSELPRLDGSVVAGLGLSEDFTENVEDLGEADGEAGDESNDNPSDLS